MPRCRFQSCILLFFFRLHKFDKINDSARISILIVVPWNQLKYKNRCWTSLTRICYMLETFWTKWVSFKKYTFINVSESWIPALTSKIEDLESPRKSVDTTASSVYPKIPFIGPSEASWIFLQMSSYLVGLLGKKRKITVNQSNYKSFFDFRQSNFS